MNKSAIKQLRDLRGKATQGEWTLDGPVGMIEGEIIYAPHGHGHTVAEVHHSTSPNQPANASFIVALVNASEDLLDMADLLKQAKCPECDGSGLHDAETAIQNLKISGELNQDCQWCAKRDELLKEQL